MALPAPGYLSNAERTNAEMKQALEDQRDFIAGIVGAVSTLTASAALTANQLGLVLIDATAGNVAVTLPESDTALGIRDVIVRRVDNSGSRVVVQAAGTGKIKFHTHLRAEGYPLLVLMGAGDYWHLRSDGAGNWWPVARRDEFPVGSYADGSAEIIPPGGYGLATGTVQAAQYPWLLDYAQQSGALCDVAARTPQDGRWSISADGLTVHLPSLGDVFRRSHILSGIRELGTYQGDAIQNITGDIISIVRGSAAAAGGAFGVTGGNGIFAVGAAGTNAGTLSFSAARVVPTADENRPKNITSYPLIKII
ncbi:MAG TPA: phage tail protein [Pseudomonas sp.]|nr:phage tail protein [Pseudomonas sp.]